MATTPTPARRGAALHGLLRARRQAAAVQRALLPQRWPVVLGLSFAAQYHPAEKLGGDFYDAFALGGGAVGLYVADVAGHGLPAALLTVFLRQVMAELQAGDSRDLLRRPGAVLAHVRGRFAAEDFGDRFITMLYGVLDRGTLVYASAGHPPPLVLRGDELVPQEDDCGPPLSGLIEPEAGWPEQEAALGSDARVVFYTDGLYVAGGRAGPREGRRTLEQLLLEGRTQQADDWARGVVAALRRDRDAGRVDDMTLLVLGVKPTTGAAVFEAETASWLAGVP